MSAKKVSSVHARISKNALAVVAALKKKKSLVWPINSELVKNVCFTLIINFFNININFF